MYMCCIECGAVDYVRSSGSQNEIQSGYGGTNGCGVVRKFYEAFASGRPPSQFNRLGSAPGCW